MQKREKRKRPKTKHRKVRRGAIVSAPHNYERLKQPRDGYNDNALRPY